MGLCVYCGKPIADGGICSCQQAVRPGYYGTELQPEISQSCYVNTQGTMQQELPQNNYGAVQPEMAQNSYGAVQPEMAQNNYSAVQPEIPQNNYSAVQPEEQVKQDADNKKGIVVSVLHNIKENVNNPIDAAVKYYENASLKTSALSIAILAIIYIATSFLSLIGNALHILSTYKRGIKDTLSINGMSFSQYLREFGTTRGKILRDNGIPGEAWIQSIFFPIVYMLLMGLIIVILVYFINAFVVRKDKINLANIVRFFGAVSMPTAAALIIRLVNGFVYVNILNGTVFAGLYTVMIVIAMLQGMAIIKKIVPDGRKFLAVFCSMAFFLTVFNYFIDNMFLKDFFPWFNAMPGMF